VILGFNSQTRENASISSNGSTCENAAISSKGLRPPKGGHRISLFSSRTNCATDQKVLTIVSITGDIHLLPTIMAASI